MRLMASAWLGAGTALEQIIAEPGGLDLLKQMAKNWPFFSDLLDRSRWCVPKPTSMSRICTRVSSVPTRS